MFWRSTLVLLLSRVATVLVLVIGLSTMMTKTFDHERLDVYRLSIDYVAYSFEVSQSLGGLYRSARDQSLRAAQSIPLNIAEGNGKRSRKDRARFLDIARGSALECAAIRDVLLATNGIKVQNDAALKKMLNRIVAMLTRLALKFNGVAESTTDYHAEIDYDYEHRFAQHEHDSGSKDNPEPSRVRKGALLQLKNLRAYRVTRAGI